MDSAGETGDEHGGGEAGHPERLLHQPSCRRDGTLWAVDEREEFLRRTASDLERAGFARICGRPLEMDEADLLAYKTLLDAGPSELDLQRFLTDHPRIFRTEFGIHCRWIKAHPQFGSQFTPDFLTARIDSNPWIRWTLVELQRSDAGLFTQDRRKRSSEQFDEGIRQIIEWRDWITQNGDYARKPQGRHGLGLTGLTPQADGLILIGRRNDISIDDRKRARSLTWPHHIEVHTYDWLADEASNNIEFWRSYGGDKTCYECELIGQLR